MRFVLSYDGDLKANGSKNHKQAIRRSMHLQLRQLWMETPYPSLRSPADSLCTELDGWRFFPLASALRGEVVELRVTMLSPAKIGAHLITHGGDIDNRLKTLFDALRMPREKGELPRGDRPGEGEDPFFCVMSDDSLITEVSVSTKRLLTPAASRANVKLLIEVQIERLRPVGGSMIGRVA